MAKFGQGSDVEGGDNLQSSVPSCWDLFLPDSVFDLHWLIASSFCKLLSPFSHS